MRPERRGLWAVLGALMLGMLLAALDQTIVSTALPTIVSDLGGLNHLSWVVTAYLLAVTASTPLWGKLGDQYGRKPLFMSAIVIFLVGSAVCGLSQNMGMLIGFRALQGLGGGGLMSLAMAIVGDVVPPRERGRYQGLFGAVFGVSSVGGPLLGGFFVDNLTWRWVFYINLPIGAVALVVVAAVLHAREARHTHRIDYLGMVLLSGWAVCLVLVTTWGGTQYPWASPQIIGLLAAAVVLIAAWIVFGRRAAEPVLPLHLFGRRVFVIAAAIGFAVGFAMFGALTFLPLFLQVVHGVSPTLSGVHLLPTMLGLLAMSVLSGQIIARTGHYKPFPIMGTAVTAVGLYLLSRMDEHTSTLMTSVYFCVLGLGLGLVMQVLIIAVQNAVDYSDLGAATSGATFFRAIGGSFGVAAFGAIFSSRLAVHMAQSLRGLRLPPGFTPQTVQRDPKLLSHLPPQVAARIVHAYAASIQNVFVWAVPMAAVAFALSWFLKEVPLRGLAGAPDLGEGVGGAPTDRTSLDEAERVVARRAAVEMRRGYYERLSERDGGGLGAPGAWVLCRLARQGDVAGVDLAKQAGTTVARGRPHVDRLVERGLVERRDGVLALTGRGRERAERLVDLGCADLERLADCEPHNTELRERLRAMARDLLGDDADRRVFDNRTPRP